MDQHYHDETGNMVFVEPSPAAEELAATETITSAEVEIARINAERDIQLARLANKNTLPDLELQLAEAQAELAALKALMTPPEPEQEPEPVVIVNDPEPELPEVEETLPVPEPMEDRKPQRKNPWVSQY